MAGSLPIDQFLNWLTEM